MKNGKRLLRLMVASLWANVMINNLFASEYLNEKEFYVQKYYEKTTNTQNKKQENNVKENVLREFRKILRQTIENGNTESLCVLIQKFINPCKLPQEECIFRSLFADDNAKVNFLEMLSMSDFAERNEIDSRLIEKMNTMIAGMSMKSKTEAIRLFNKFIGNLKIVNL